MKNVLMIISFGVVFCFVTVSQAQVSDTASLNYNNQSTVKDAQKDTHNESPVSQEDSEQEDSRVGASSGVKEGTVSSEDQQVQQLPKPTEEQTDQNTNSSQPSNTEKRAGSKEKKSVLKKGNSYYKDEGGKSVKDKKSQAKDKSDGN
jgi:hypothetical protein